ncbi:hypothetical protein RYX36_019550 [Vicia faba]
MRSPFLRPSRGNDQMAACGQLGNPGTIQAPMLRVLEQFQMAVGRRALFCPVTRGPNMTEWDRFAHREYLRLSNGKKMVKTCQMPVEMSGMSYQVEMSNASGRKL